MGVSQKISITIAGIVNGVWVLGGCLQNNEVCAEKELVYIPYTHVCLHGGLYCLLVFSLCSFA